VGREAGKKLADHGRQVARELSLIDGGRSHDVDAERARELERGHALPASGLGGAVKASVMARLYGSCTTRKWCSAPATAFAAPTTSARERASWASGGWRYAVQVAVP